MKINKEDVCIFIPCLNEAPTIGGLIKEFKKLGFNDILIMDGHSNDGTPDIARKLGATVRTQTGRGKGNAIMEAIDMIDKPYVVMLDGDGTYLPKDAEKMVRPLFMGLDREDINLIMLSGCVVSWFNVIDIEKVAAVTGTPVICVTYEDSDGLEGDIAHHFPGDAGRLRAYQKLGEREGVILPTGYEAFIRYTGISGREAHRICSDMTKDGRVPEPLRVSRLLARSIMHNMNCLR